MDQISQTTIKEIVEAVNIVEVQKIAQKFQFDLGKERVINLMISGCIYNPSCIIKFVAFLKELVEKNFFEDFNIKKKLQMIQGKCLAKNKIDFITKNFFLKSYSIEDDMKLCNIFTSFFGHCYNNDLLDSNFPLFTLQLFNSYQLKKITILNYWLIVGEKFTNSIKYKNRKIVQEVQQKIDKIKILEDGFENEIFSNTEMEIIKYFENLPEKKIVDEILDFPNLEGDQKKLDMIFLINIYKVNLKLSVKEENYVKEIQERFKNECYENVLDFRYIDESKIEQTFKEFIEKVNENNLELTLREVTWLGGRNFILTQQHSQIDKNHIKFFMLEVFKQQNSENIAEYLGKLENVSSHLSYFTGLISKFCTDFLECCEELLDQKKVSKIQIFKTLKFTGNLYKHDVIKFGAITKIINKLDSQNFRNLIKFLGFEISEKFVKDMKNEFIKKSSTATEILAEVEEKMQKTSLESSPKRIKLEKNLPVFKSQKYLKIINIKNLLLKDQKNLTVTSIFLDQFQNGFITLEDYEPKKLVEADNLTGVMECIILRALESKIIYENFINFLDKLYEIYKRFEEVLDDNFKKIIENLFKESIGGAVDWKKVNSLSGMINDAHMDYECTDKNAVKICLINNVLNFACTKDDWEVAFNVILNFVEEIFKNRPEAFYNYLEYVTDVYTCKEMNPFVNSEVLAVWKCLWNVEGGELDKNRVENIKKKMKFYCQFGNNTIFK